MIDVSIIKHNDSEYSIKTSIFEKGEHKAQIKVLYLYEVRTTGSTSFQKIRTIYDANVDDTKFNIEKYKGIFDKLVDKLTRKYGFTTILI